ncbi:MAG: hypothetical protein ACLUNZ_02020 [Evtepia sp.]
MAIVLALVVGSLFIAVLGHNPIAVYHDIITGSLGGPSTAKVTVRVAIPLLGAAPGHRPGVQDEVLEHRRGGPDHGGRHCGHLLRPLLV